MGYGVPAAIAASLLYPQRTVVNVAGDGDFLMTGQELATATGYERRPRPRQADLASWSTTAATAPSACTRSATTRARVSGTDLFNPDFVRLAEAYGWHGARVDRTEQFEAAFAQALAARRGRRCCT